MLLVQSRVLPVPHGFTTRRGGVSQGAFASLNLGLSVGDEAGSVRENLRRVGNEVGLAPEAFHTVTQVHGDCVLKVPSSETTTAVLEADALWTAAPSTAVGIRTADCVPILLVDSFGQRVMAVHSGWRGTELDIVSKAVKVFLDAGSTVKHLFAAIGPSIRSCCYEVGPDLGRRFLEKFGPSVALARGVKWHLDLSSAVYSALCEAGIPRAHIDLLPHCTFCDQQTFFSHRRDQGRTGRHLAFAVCEF